MVKWWLTDVGAHLRVRPKRINKMVMFLEKEDYKAVVDDKTLDVVNQSDGENLARAERYAIEEISGYLRAALSSKTGIRPFIADFPDFESETLRQPGDKVIQSDVACVHH